MATKKGPVFRVVSAGQESPNKKSVHIRPGVPGPSACGPLVPIASTPKAIPGPSGHQKKTPNKRGLKRPMSAIREDEERIRSLPMEDLRNFDLGDGDDEGGGAAALRILRHSHEEMDRVRLERANNFRLVDCSLVYKDIYESFAHMRPPGSTGIKQSNRIKVFMARPVDKDEDPAKWKLYL